MWFVNECWCVVSLVAVISYGMWTGDLFINVFFSLTDADDGLLVVVS